jgi:phospholipase/carboxylesterase
MNRFQNDVALSLPTQQSSPSPPRTLPTFLAAKTGLERERAFFAPVHYEPNYQYPLLVWLHGRTNDERQLLWVMPRVSDRNYVAVAPRGLRVASADWDAESTGWSQSSEVVAQAEQRIFDAIDAAGQRFNINPARVFLAGSDCGGTMAFRIAMSHPDRFAGVLSIGGPFPSGRKAFGQWSLARRLAMFLAVARENRQYPPTRACTDLRLLYSAGMSVTLRQYPCAQALTAKVLGDVNRWVMEQIHPPKDAAATSDHPSSRSAE